MIRSGQEAWDLVVSELANAEQYPTSPPDPDATPLPFTDQVRFEHVRFRYDDGTAEVLRGIDLTVPAGGNSLAIVGGSGAGKSTLVDILLGLHDPTSGRVRVDGVDIAGDMAGWQRNVAMVPQEVYLFDVSLAENISFDTPPRAQIDPPDRLAEAIRGAQLESFVADQPEGVDTDFGERGSRLSGGQRQRIGIARACTGTRSCSSWTRPPRAGQRDRAPGHRDRAGAQRPDHRRRGRPPALHGASL